MGVDVGRVGVERSLVGAARAWGITVAQRFVARRDLGGNAPAALRGALQLQRRRRRPFERSPGDPVGRGFRRLCSNSRRLGRDHGRGWRRCRCACCRYAARRRGRDRYSRRSRCGHDAARGRGRRRRRGRCRRGRRGGAGTWGACVLRREALHRVPDIARGRDGHDRHGAYGDPEHGAITLAFGLGRRGLRMEHVLGRVRRGGGLRAMHAGRRRAATGTHGLKLERASIARHRCDGRRGRW